MPAATKFVGGDIAGGRCVTLPAKCRPNTPQPPGDVGHRALRPARPASTAVGRVTRSHREPSCSPQLGSFFSRIAIYNSAMWRRYMLSLPPQRRGFHLITPQVVDVATDLAGVNVGLLHVFIQHTSASLTINENADPDVRVDLESSLSAIAPEDFPYVHTLEGPDDMPAHVKASLLGSSVSIPVEGGRLALGTWQGIYLCEHRDRATARRLIITLHGE